jgi:signal peptidase I
MNSSASILGDEHALKCEIAGEVLRASGTLRLRVSGWSMLPTIWPGDTLVIERASSGDVFDGSDGDIVMFSNGRRFVAHRVVTKSSGSGDSMVRTQGDAVPHPDSPVARGDLLGKVSYILRNGTRMEPNQKLGFSERAVAAVFRRSEIAARVVVRVHRMRRNSRIQTL